MPASQLDWSTCQKRPVFFEVFCNKRKAEAQSTQEDAPPDGALPGVKRQCHWPHQVAIGGVDQTSQPSGLPQAIGIQDSAEMSPMNNNTLMPNQMSALPGTQQDCCMSDSDMAEINHNSVTDQDMNQLLNPALNKVLSQQPPRVPSPWPSHHLPTSQQQQQGANCMIMDLNDEIINPCAAKVAEAEAACMSMDSDCAPDQQQYGTRVDSTPESFCRNFCGAGHESPTSGRVRCYCKPSWEGMMDLRPYSSDVY